VTGAIRKPGTASASEAARDSDASGNRLVLAYDAARGAGDVDGMVTAALALAAGRVFGSVPGRVPAFLYEAYTLAGGEHRARLAVAVARAWAYGGDPARAVEFADEALVFAEAQRNPTLLAQALDAQLLAHWGPDDLDERLRITRRLEDTVAHETDVEARMSAYLWRLTTALEVLDLSAVRRQLCALSTLAEESGSSRVRFYAESRRGMYGLLVGDLPAAERAIGDAVAAGTAAGEADTLAIERTLSAGLALARGDTTALAREAAAFEAFGISEAVPSIAAQAALFWAVVGECDRARTLLHQLAGLDFGGIARDVDWMLTVTALTETAVLTGDVSLTGHAVRVLTPYVGRGVVDAGGVAFAGVVDDYLHQACALLGRHADARSWARSAGQAYQRMGAAWWQSRVRSAAPAAPRTDVQHLRPGDGGIWWFGPDGATTTIRDMKGLRYLRLLVDRPGIDLPALELSDAVAGHPGSRVDQAGTGPLLDRHALAAYRRRLHEIDHDLDEATRHANDHLTAHLESERDALIDQLRAATGLDQRERTTGTTSERARVAVRKAITAAINRIAATNPSLARLLQDTISTGAVCRYDPDPDRPTQWVLST
jgi:hypothetical protein